MTELAKILLVDDEEDFCFFVKGHLEMTGKYQVRTVNSGSEGLREARGFQPDLILLDIVLPDMSGDEVATALMEDTATRDLQVVFLTALASNIEDDEDSSIQDIGGRYFIGKPIGRDKLIEAIDSVLG